MKISGIFVGTAGVYHVMSELALRGYHASVTHGNAPNFDILVCNSDGSRCVAIQVKSTTWAKRDRGRGENRKLTKLDFPLGFKAAKIKSEDVLFVFVDFGVLTNQKADIYLIPSTRLHKFCEPWIDNNVGKMVRFQPEIDWVKEFKIQEDNDWELLKKAGIKTTESADVQTEPTGPDCTTSTE